ncbi:type II toxin-antitoxin system prevent-host-death family antitoxin [Gordonia sp. VNQ95]|uniref:type II toxin-antitoxin system Phd/YefM family antitoxin n=1 Tax=Gordonia TaxID=2053 RepID=UPI0032B3CB90
MTESVSVGELRQNPTAALSAVADGRTLVVTKHNRPVAELRPISKRIGVAPREFAALMRSHAHDTRWAEELADQRAEDVDDPWER